MTQNNIQSLLVIPANTNITLQTPIISSNGSTVLQQINWIIQNNVYLYYSDIQNAVTQNTACILRTSTGDTSAQIIQ
ncbi:MAG: hypothetical protein QXV17_01440 [Candidatus Micrarchaeaceae archaeon]